MAENEISEKIIGCAIQVHKELGPGRLEPSYEECLCYELRQLDLVVEKEKPLPLTYKTVNLDCGYRIDLMVEKKVIIEVKSVAELDDIHLAQVLTYLKLSKCKLGLLINFNEVLVKDGIKRIVNKL